MANIRPAILIVGAGAAGIAAATKLITNGFSNVIILEAENRIGGRLHSLNFGGAVVDLGAQWIHGEQGNVVYEMVKDLDITSRTVTTRYDDFTFYASNNARLNKNLTDRLHEIAQEVLEDETAATEYRGPLGMYFKERYYEKVKQKFGSDSEELIKLASMIEEWTGKFFLCLDPADSWHKIAARSIVAYKRCEGDPLINWKNNGYSKILDILITKDHKLSKEEFLENHVQLNKEVKKIIWNRDDEIKKAIIYCTDESQYKADHIVLTLSVGALNRIHKTAFEPNLPSYKVNCLEHIPLGTCHKILLRFPRKWWPDDVKDFSFLWTDDDKISVRKQFPDGPLHEGRFWLEDIFGFYTIDCDPNILLGWLVGPTTKQVELLPDEIVQNASMFLLNKFLGKTYDVIEPVDILRSKWGTNPHFLGTYSYVGVDMDERGATNEDLAKPLLVDGKPVVLFAGEATHSRYFSTVHGAIETGFREADRLADLYKNYHKVAIVGAGMAGLGAAKKLTENHIDDFVVLEAQNQAGGRIKTIYINGKPLDVGAQWMHGKSNPLYKIAVANNLLSEEVSEEGLGHYVRSNGSIVDQFKVDVVAYKLGQILEDCAKLVNSNDCPPLSVLLDQHFYEYLQEQVDDVEQIEIYKELYDWHVRFQVIDNSCRDLSRLSAKGWGEYVCLDDEAHSNFRYGYQSLVNVLLDGLPNGCINYDSVVTKIAFTKDKQVKLDIEGARSVICDHLILTPSLGVLKDLQGLSDVFPRDLLENIRNMGFAGICKIYLFYNEKWWGDAHGFQLLWHESCTFKEKHSWLRQITGFDEVFNHETALMTWVGGDAVREAETLHPDAVGRQCTELLRKFLANYVVPTPRKVIRTQWLSDPFVKGSYCHITPECDGPNSGIRALGRPVIIDDVPRIILAGEAIHPSHYSTTHGAFESGLDQAEIICNSISNLK